jgi:hypothetical protein
VRGSRKENLNIKKKKRSKTDDRRNVIAISSPAQV